MRVLLLTRCEQSQISPVARRCCMLHEDLFQSYRNGVLEFCRIKIFYQDIYYSPGALRFILREVDIKLEVFFEIEG